MLQTNRALRAFKLNKREETEVPVITDINELTKQTQSEVTAKALELAVRMAQFETAALTADAFRKFQPAAGITPIAQPRPRV